MEAPPIRVLVADDHPLFRRGVVRALSEAPDVEVVAEAEDGASALDQIRRWTPEVALLDIRMRDMHGPDVLRAVVREGLPTRVLFLSAYAEPDVIYRALADGAAGYVSKDTDDREVCEAVLSVAAGGMVVAKDLQATLFAEIRRGAGGRPALSPREHEILTLIAEGLGHEEIASRLHISAATVRTYMARVYEKLGVSDRGAAVAKAMREGLLN